MKSSKQDLKKGLTKQSPKQLSKQNSKQGSKQPDSKSGPIPLSIYIPEHILDEVNGVIKAAVKGGFGECSWLGAGTFDRMTGTAIVTQIFWPEQVNSSGSTEMDDKSIAEIAPQLELDEKIIWWGHSHGTMSTFYSGTDTSTWGELTDGGLPFFFGSCHNSKGEDPYQIVHYEGFDFQDVDIIDYGVQEGDYKDILQNFSKPSYSGSYYRGNTTSYGNGSTVSYGTSYGNTTSYENGTSYESTGYTSYLSDQEELTIDIEHFLLQADSFESLEEKKDQIQSMIESAQLCHPLYGGKGFYEDDSKNTSEISDTLNVLDDNFIPF
jgi:hypothetical protein